MGLLVGCAIAVDETPRLHLGYTARSQDHASGELSPRTKRMTATITHPQEPQSNADRALAGRFEPRSLRTYTPSQAIFARSAGVYHWTPEGRRLYDFSSGVLVANLGHNPVRWMQRFFKYMGWPESGPGFQ